MFFNVKTTTTTTTISLLYLPRIEKLILVVETTPKQDRCHKIDDDHVFGPKTKRIWALFV